MKSPRRDAIIWPDARNRPTAPGNRYMDEETKALLRSIAHHLKWVIVLLVAILGILVARTLT